MKWHNAFGKLRNAESVADSGNASKPRNLIGEALNLFAILSVRHPDFHPDLVRERMRDIVDKLEGKSSIKKP